MVEERGFGSQAEVKNKVGCGASKDCQAINKVREGGMWFVESRRRCGDSVSDDRFRFVHTCGRKERDTSY